MSRKYLVLIIIFVFAIVFNCLVIGILVSQPFAQNSLNMNYIDKPVSKVIARVIPRNILPSTSPVLSPASSDSFPNIDKVTITAVQTNFSEGSFLVFISNYNSQATITDVFVNGCPANLEKNLVIPANSSLALLLILPDGIIFARTYEIRLLSSDGQSALFYKIVC
jgi:hypothetical protein